MLKSRRSTLYAILVSNQLLLLVRGSLVHSVVLHFFSRQNPSVTVKNISFIRVLNTIAISGQVLLLCITRLFDKIQRRVCNTVDPDQVSPLQPLSHRNDVASTNIARATAWMIFLGAMTTCY